MNKILFLGYLNENLSIENGVSVAGYKMQKNIIESLAKKNDTSITAVSIKPTACYPKVKEIFFKYKKLVNESFECFYIPFINIQILKQITQILSTIIIMMRLLLKEKYNVIICFNSFPQVCLPIKLLRKFFKKTKYICILADLPIDDIVNRKTPSRVLRKIMDKTTIKNINIYDGYVVLNGNVVKKYLKDKEFVIVEGGIDANEISTINLVNNKKNKEEISILYTGSLNYYSGILNLIESYNYFDECIYLDICGGGEFKDNIIEFAKKDYRIRYHGVVSNDLAIEMQKRASYLINPRIIDNEISKVTFPSKIFEYFASGTPVVMTKIEGINNEYDNYYVRIDSDVPINIAETIKQLYYEDYEKMTIMASEAMKFILDNKNWDVQTDKLIALINKL